MPRRRSTRGATTAHAAALALAWTLLAPLAGAAVLIDDAADAPRVAVAGADGRVTGELPAPWRDDSAWARVWVEHAVADGVLRSKVTRLESGRAQIVHDLPPIERATCFRLRLRARATGGLDARIAIRALPAPYAYAWQRRLAVGARWTDLAWDVLVAARSEPCGLFIELDGPGTLEVTRLRLESMSPDEHAAALAAESPVPRTGNLLRISRLPLGLQAGWALGPDDSEDVVDAVADPAVPGPSGAPALRLASAAPMTLASSPCPIAARARRHVLSVAVRGAWSGRIAVCADGRTLAETACDGADDAAWRVIAVPFMPDPYARAHIVRVTGSGRAWFDAWQLEEGERATAWRAPAPCEVALAVADPARVQFADEPDAVAVVVLGDRASTTLRASVVDAYGDERPLAPSALDAGGRGTLRYAAFADRPYGAHRIQAWTEDAHGERTSPVAEIVVLRLPRPRHLDEDAPASRFGVHADAVVRHLRLAKAIGAGWVRLHDAGTQYLGWAALEPNRGGWRFRDDAIARYRRHHLAILGVLETSPPWANGLDRARDGYADQWYAPTDLDAWSGYVATVAARYRGAIAAYEVWNEPWGPAFFYRSVDDAAVGDARFRRGEHAAADYVELMRRARDAARTVDPAIVIVGVNGAAGRADWSADVVAAGGLAACDAVSYHHYPTEPPSRLVDAVRRGFHEAIDPLVAGGAAAPRVWLSEGSPGGGVVGDGLYQATIASDEDCLASSDRLARFLVAVLACGVEREFLYSLHTYEAIGAGNEWRSLVCADGSPHPSAAAHAALARLLDDARAVGSVAVADGVDAQLFATRDRAVAALIPRAGHARYLVPRVDGGAIADVLGNPLPPDTAVGDAIVYVEAAGSADALAASLTRH